MPQSLSIPDAVDLDGPDPFDALDPADAGPGDAGPGDAGSEDAGPSPARRPTPVAAPPRPVRRPPKPIAPAVATKPADLAPAPADPDAASEGGEPATVTPTPAAVVPPAPARSKASPAPASVVCPFCGARRPVPAGGDTGDPTAVTPCPRCTVADTPEVRAATRRRVGPWAVYQDRVPSAPGMNYRTLIALATAGRVTPASVVRGPTTGQLWRPADRVRGLAREFGRCHACAAPVRPDAVACPACRRDQRPPADPDALIAPDEASESVPAIPPGSAPQSQARPASAGRGRGDPGTRSPEAGLASAPRRVGTGAPSSPTNGNPAPPSGAAPSGASPRARAATAAATSPPSPVASRPPPSRPPPSRPPPARPPSRASARAAEHAAGRASVQAAGAILSARELASAFRLDTAPGFDPDAPDRPVPDRPVPGGPADLGRRSPRANRRARRGVRRDASGEGGARPRRRAGRRVALTLAAGLLVATAGIGGLWVYPPTRPDVESAARAAYARAADLLPAVEF